MTSGTAEEANGREVAPVWVPDDGGRAAAGFRGDTGDCVARSIAIAGRMDYEAVKR